MLLYYCPQCGRWQDVRLVQVLSTIVDNFAKALKQSPCEHLGYPCPAGHGFMIQIQSTDRIVLCPADGEIEAAPEPLREQAL